VGRGFHPSGRVIALGRLLLAAMFVVAIAIDVTQPAKAPLTTYILLGSYLGFAALAVALTWNNWWFDARLAGPAHAIDILLFTLLVFMTEGYTSPYLIFFVFLLLSAAIRWGWRETTLTAILLTVLYLGTGLLALNADGAFDIPRFLVRTAQLVIASLILIWFGANQWRSRPVIQMHELLANPSLDKSPLETALRAAMKDVGATRGAIVWRDSGRPTSHAIAFRDRERREIRPRRRMPDGCASGPFLYNVPRSRGLKRDSERSLRRIDPGDQIVATIERIGTMRVGVRAAEGTGIPVMSGASAARQ